MMLTPRTYQARLPAAVRENEPTLIPERAAGRVRFPLLV